MMHPDVFVAQTTAAHTNHFYKAIMAANEYPGPAVINVYTTCQPEHGVADDKAMYQAKLAADSRAFPVFIYDPRGGDRISERLSLQGNPAKNKDFYVNPKQVNKLISYILLKRKVVFPNILIRMGVQMNHYSFLKRIGWPTGICYRNLPE
jgi:pyruvate/2-oxoacid:ferredoxin oxidoreductase beta subunit